MSGTRQGQRGTWPDELSNAQTRVAVRSANEPSTQAAVRTMKKIACIVMPTYNEAANLPELFPRIFAQAENIPSHELHVLIVDDNSPDGTATLVEQWMAGNPRIHLLRGEKKGLGDAYKRGMAHAIATLDPELILQMDADQQHDPTLLPLFISLTRYGFSLVIGSRFAPGAGEPALSFRRRMISRVGTVLVRLAGGLPRLHDCTSGYRCIRADLITKCDLGPLATRGYSFQSSLLSELMRNGSRVVEIPIVFGPRAHGASKLSLTDQIEFVTNLGRLWRNRFRTRAVESVKETAT
jgi:dolichol-phosphate mannosyltransferase